MADNIVSYRVDIQDDGTPKLNNIGEAAGKTNSAVGKLEDTLTRIGSVSFGINFIVDTIGKLWNMMEACEGAYRKQEEAETKLAQVMQNTMNATSEDIQLIKDLTAAQQQLGVVGDEVQLAGAQELSTYLEKKESLQELIPVMNDMLAKQNGLNATQENAASVADMMGKAMRGQTMMMERAGFAFTEAQEQIMKFGTEEDKASVLAEVMKAKVGGMNEALAQTPAGQMQQYAMGMGDVQERLGALYTRIMKAMLPAMNRMVVVMNKVLDVVNDTITFVSSNLDIIAAMATGITAIAVASNALAIKMAVVTLATKAWAVAQAILNAVMTANPIGLIIAGIAALVAAILWVSKHTEGWGTLWDATVTFMKETFYAWVDGVKLYFGTAVNGIMIGLDKIKLGWYKFKEACGLGNAEENKSAIAKINADVEARQKAIADGAKSMMQHLSNARHAFDNVSIRWKSGEDASADTNTQILQRANGQSGGGGAGGSFGSATSSSASAIASGGTRNTSITINFSKEMVKMDFNGGYLDNKEQVEATLAESLLRVLNAAKASV